MNFDTIAQLVVSGLTIGCVYSLIGLGFALTLKATDLINFAHSEMVMLGAFFGLMLTAQLGVPFVGAVIISAVATGLVGVIIERCILGPIMVRKAPQLNLLIATLGLSIALQALAIIIWGREPIAYPDLFSSQPLVILGLRVQPLQVWIMGVSLVVMGALQWFFQRTVTGIAWRAASLDATTAALYGVGRRRNVALTFGLSAALGGAAGVLIAPLFFASFGLGHSLIIKAFAATALGGFGIVGTMVGGLLLGVIETLTAGLISSDYKNVITYSLLIAILMLFFRPRLPKGRPASDAAKVSVSDISALLATPGRKITLFLGLLALWAAVGWFGDAYLLRIVNMSLIAALAALGLQVIVGLTGQFSFGQAGFYGIGAYTSALVTMKLGLPFWVGLPLAGLFAAGAALIVAPILRLSGHFLAMATLALGEIIVLLMLNLKFITNGAYGLYGIPLPAFGSYEVESEGAFFVLISAVLVLVYAAVVRLLNSRFGRSLVAVRENELAAIACGIRADRQKVKAFVIGCGCAGLAGSLYAHYLAYISPESFSFLTSVQMVTMVVIGGLGSLPGAIIGAFGVTLLPEMLRVLADFRLVVYGGLIILFMLFLPGGLAEVGRRATSAVFAPRKPGKPS